MAVQNSPVKPPQTKCIFSFISPTETTRISYQQQKQRLSSALRRHPWFNEGIFLETMEKGVMFPVIHCLEVPPTKMISTVPLLPSSVFGDSFNLQQAVYAEIKEFRPDNEHLMRLSERPNPDRSYILLAFKTLDSTFSDVLEDSWKDWTGARQIYMNLPDDMGLSRFTFYRRLAPLEDATSFFYILVVQCESVPSTNYFRMLDFVHRFRVHKMMGYITVYRELRAADVTNCNGYLNGVLDHIDDQGTKVDI